MVTWSGQAGAILLEIIALKVQEMLSNSFELCRISNDLLDPDTGLRVLHKSINLKSFVFGVVAVGFKGT